MSEGGRDGEKEEGRRGGGEWKVGGRQERTERDKKLY